MSITITINRPTNRRVEPEESPYAELMHFEINTVFCSLFLKDMLDLTPEQMCEELFAATNAPEELLNYTQKYLRELYTKELANCENKDINFFSMSVGDFVEIRSDENVFSLNSFRCDPVGWTKAKSPSTGVLYHEIS